MGCGVSKLRMSKEGETSCLYTRLSLVRRPGKRVIANRYLPAIPSRREEGAKGDGTPKKVNIIEEKEMKPRGNFEKEEACIDKGSCDEGLNDRDDGISFMQSPSFRVYCIPSQFEDGISEGGDGNPEGIIDNRKVDDVQNDKISSIRREKTISSGKEKRSVRSRFLRYMTFLSS